MAVKYVKKLAVLILQLVLISPLFAGENPFLNPRYLSSVFASGELRINTNEGLLSITSFGPGIVRVALLDSEKLQPSYAVIAHPDTNDVAVTNHKNTVTVTLDSLLISVQKSPLEITFIRKGTNDTLSVQKAVFSRKDTSGFRFRLEPHEMIFGGGERAISMNRRGYHLRLNNEAHYGYGWGAENLNFSVPYFVSSNQYGILFDNPSIGYADLGKKDAHVMELGATGGQLVYYFLAGKSFDGLHHEMARLTGTQPMPPRWALGNLQSRFGYKTEKQAYDVVDSMKLAGYPLDGIILDLFWFGQGPKDWRMGHLDWYKPNWPTPKKMIADFKKKGVHTILITEPYILQSSKNFAEADSLGILADDETGKTGIIKKFYFGKAGLIDMFDPVAQNWFWKKYNKQIEIGVSGWWGDLGEPETLPSNLVFVNGKANDVKNAYGLVWSKMLHDKYAANYPNVRLFHLNRAGYAGSQRYSSFPWSGDVGHTWAGLRAQIPIMLGMSMCQIPYISSDLGGFSIGKKDEKLYRRWLQFGVFNPIFRPHSGTALPEPIYYSDSTQNIVRRFIKLRYQLMPYNYTLAWRQSVEGEPLAAPVFYKSNYPKTYWDNNDLYYWGNAFLVSPILEPGKKVKDILLPEGIWFDYFSGKKYLGNGWVHYMLNDSTIPVFVKAGSFIPSVPVFYSTNQYTSRKLIVDYYHSSEVKTSKYTMYEDDGHTRNAFTKGKYELLYFTESSHQNKMVFRFTRGGGHYSGAPKNRDMKLIVHHAGPISAVEINQQLIPLGKNHGDSPYKAYFEGQTLVIKFSWKMNDGVTIKLN